MQDLDLHLEGGHSARRIVHAGDMTGREVERALIEAVNAKKNVRVLEEHMAVDLITLAKYGGPEVCAGAYALGQAGLLTGRRCTTHHALVDELARRYPAARVQHDVLYVVDGRVVTSAGIASGIDLALHLVATRHGAALAAKVAREMVVYARRNGGEPQQEFGKRIR